ncbi:uncharacterized protein [Miscanthus floridulus]|uniref:uncharacterized protein n=1 Tax=Miscanthus floridulus TaxID=154761 RepID=UPI003459A304
MPEVVALMNHAKEKIKASFSAKNKRSLLNKIIQIIESRWDRQMDTPLYGAALFLNPGKFYTIQKENDEYVGHLRGCFNDVLARMVEDESIRNKIDQQSMLYEDQRGDILKNFDWWRTYGGRSIDLQRFAKRIVSLCASSSGCERNWSTFEFIHTKKRNRLEHKRLNDLVYVSYNRKMTSRFQKRREEAGKSYAPLVIEDFDWNNEWVDPMAQPEGARGSDLTWDQVDEAIGASRELRGRNLHRTYARRARQISRVVEEDEEEGEEEEIILDDDDIDDFGEQPMDATEDGGENVDASNDLDEFALDDF